MLFWGPRSVCREVSLISSSVTAPLLVLRVEMVAEVARGWGVYSLERRTDLVREPPEELL